MRFKDIDLEKLNSATKYPSIPTLHKKLERGRLGCVDVDFEGEDVEISEKVGGASTRIIVNYAGEFIIGSRLLFLYYSEDFLQNPELGIVDALIPWARLLAEEPPAPGALRIFYGETFGGSITQRARQYTGEGQFGFRLFDVADLDMPLLRELMAADLVSISGWREGGGQPFQSGSLEEYAVPVVPRLQPSTPVPSSMEDCLTWLNELLPKTQCALDGTALGEPEGVIIRTPDRSKIAKLRLDDVRRTLRALER